MNRVLPLPGRWVGQPAEPSRRALVCDIRLHGDPAGSNHDKDCSTTSLDGSVPGHRCQVTQLTTRAGAGSNVARSGAGRKSAMQARLQHRPSLNSVRRATPSSEGLLT
jgi:hypothetical protein